MRNIIKRICLLLIAICLVFVVTGCKKDSINYIEKKLNTKVNTKEGIYAGKTIILHTNDTHGALEGYSYIAPLKASIEEQGGTVIIADNGDFTNGNIYVSISKGESAVTLMETAGYDIVSLGNHEFDFGFDKLKSNLAGRSFKTICSNVFSDGKTIFDANAIFKIGDLKIGFFGILTPETQTKVNPSNIVGLTFTEKEDLYKVAQEQVNYLKKHADVIICLSHLGVDSESAPNRSYDLASNVSGINFIIDGHSHTVMENGEHDEAIQSTGTAFSHIGMIVIDNKSKMIESHMLIATEGLNKDSNTLAMAENVISTVDAEFGSKFAETKFLLEGTKAIVRSEETNLGDLICDAMLWSVLNNSSLEVSNDFVVAVTNGGGIRASIEAGDISRSTIKTVLPFGNTIAVNYVKGSELLEALEASTYASPEAIGGFPHIAGMKIKINTTIPFDQGEEYPDSTYYAPKSIKRVEILEVNGKPFDVNATYAVVTNNFCAAGGDTYYAFKRAYDNGFGFDTSIPMDEAVVDFIKWMSSDGIIDSKYQTSSGRIIIIK